jgi:hypothetical protein
MNDVPSVDYDEQIRKHALAGAVESLPPLAAKAWKDPKARAYIRTNYGFFGGISIAELPCNDNRDVPMTGAAGEKMRQLVEAKGAQDDVRSALKSKIKAAAYGCTTRKALIELLPEFARYLPAEEEATCRTLPAVANLMSDLMKAGWPKDKKPAVKTKVKTAAVVAA